MNKKPMSQDNINDLFGKAILDYYHGKKVKLSTFSSIAGKDELPLAHLFRSYHEMPKLEQKALKLSKGNILDLGCGAGNHSLFLEQKKFDVKAIDISMGAIEVCKLRGLKNVFHQDLWQLKNEKFDTIIALMNGIGICGTLSKLPVFLTHFKSLLSSNGQVLIDSSDLVYMFEDEQGEIDIPASDSYYGEVQFYFEYNNCKGPQFDWLYIDYFTLVQYASEAGLKCELICEGEHYDYLVRLSFL